MAQPNIVVENLSKAYKIRTRTAPEQKMLYRDVANGLRRLTRMLARDNGMHDEAFWALNDVSFAVQPGDVLGVVGKNGSGKSTLLKILSRITDPTRGQVTIRGRIGSLLEVGSGFNPELSGRENIFLNGTILGMSRPEIQKRLDEIIAFAELEKFIDTPVKHYSSGMYVRLGFAVAAHLDTDILIIDEVLAVGDAGFQKKCLGKINDLSSSEGRTILFVSHSMSTIQTLCTRAIFLNDGQLLLDGETNAVIRQYQRQYEGRISETIDLTDWKHRSGTQEIGKFTSISLLNSERQLTQTINIGEKLIVQLGVQIKEPVRNLEIGVVFSNTLGQRISHVISSWEAFTPQLETGAQIIEVEIPQITFVPSMYSITLFMKRQDNRPGGSEDIIESPILFEVLPAPINGRDMPFATYCQPGEIYLPSTWRLC